MRKIIIKLPDKKVNKFRLQRVGWKGKRYVRAASLMSALARRNLKEKTAVVVKEYNGTSQKIINESVGSDDKKYLLYIASCFLEDFLTKREMNKYDTPY